MIPARAFFLVGPTAVGKTEVAHRLARRLGWGIISADSMMVYRRLDIGTATPTAPERAGITYLGLDCADPGERFSTGRYLAAIRAGLERAGDSVPQWMVVGGTGLYVKALTEGLSVRSPGNAGWRKEAETLLAREGLPALREEVRRRAPEAFARLRDPSNPRRLVRAVETAGERRGAGAHPPAQPRLIGLNMERSLLYERIGKRVESMFRDGLLDEARSLRESGEALSDTARDAIGYREAFGVLEGTLTPEEAVEAMARRTRRLAKRQGTWFRHQHDVSWIDVKPERTPDEVAAAVADAWEEYGPADLRI